MKKPYIRKISEINGIVVWSVDGNYVRTNLDEEFTNFGQHYRFEIIPKKEFWIDKEVVKDEEKFYIDHLLAENRLMNEGYDYWEANKIAGKIERRERKKEVILKNGFNKLNKEKKTERLKLRQIKKYDNKKINVWVVDGNLVRSMLFIDFTEGGHDKVYKFIPEGEIWIDNDLSLRERKFVLLHEAHERNLMAKGMCYDDAHSDSSKIEFFYRHNKGDIDRELTKELNGGENT